MRIKIGILYGGNSVERDISIQSAENIMKFIDKEKYNVELFEVPKEISIQNKQWIFELVEFSPHIVFSALHGGIGENGAVQGLLECFGIKYIGSGILSSAVGIDKYLTKLIMRENHISVIDDVFLNKNSDIVSFAEKINEIGYPVIVKPNNGGCSIGITVAENFDEVKKAVLFIKNELDDDILIEKFISGKEVTCVVTENKGKISVLPVMDIVTHKKFYDYKSKYVDDEDGVYFSTMPEFMQTMTEEMAKKVFYVLKCKDYACVDFVIYEEQIYVLEINTLPGLTAYSTLIRSLKEAEIKLSDFFDKIIKDKLN